MRKTPYQIFKAGIKEANSSINKTNFICIYGNSDYFIEEASSFLKSKFIDKSIEVEVFETSKVTAGDLQGFLSESSFFSEKVVYFLQKTQASSSFIKKLEPIDPNLSSDNLVIIHYHQKKVPAKLLKALEKLNTKFIACDEPYANDYPSILGDMSKKYRIQLDATASKTMLDSIGNDAIKLKNEINKLSLVFPDSEKKLTTNDLSSILGVIREDQAFALEKMILNQKDSEAYLLISDLLRRGESHLMLLGFISNFIRKVLNLTLARPENKKDTFKSLRVPEFMQNDYLKFMKKTNLQSYKKALNQCQWADKSFKTTTTSPEVVLTDILHIIFSK